MKWEVKITQDLKYLDTLVATFGSLAAADAFITMVMNHCTGIKDITINAILPEDKKDDAAAEV